MAAKKRIPVTQAHLRQLIAQMVADATDPLSRPRDRARSAQVVINAEKINLEDEKGVNGIDPVLQIELIEVKKKPRTTLGE